MSVISKCKNLNIIGAIYFSAMSRVQVSARSITTYSLTLKKNLARKTAQ